MARRARDFLLRRSIFLPAPSKIAGHPSSFNLIASTKFMRESRSVGTCGVQASDASVQCTISATVDCAYDHEGAAGHRTQGPLPAPHPLNRTIHSTSRPFRALLFVSARRAGHAPGPDPRSFRPWDRMFAAHNLKDQSHAPHPHPPALKRQGDFVPSRRVAKSITRCPTKPPFRGVVPNDEPRAAWAYPGLESAFPDRPT